MSQPRPKYTTGVPVCDALLPAALRLVGAVHEVDPEEVDDALEDARKAANRPDWQHLLLLTLAALVPDGDTPATLLAWVQHDRPRYQPQPWTVRGEEHPAAKLTSIDVAEIRANFRRGTPGETERYMRKYGVGKSCIYKILSQETRRAG